MEPMIYKLNLPQLPECILDGVEEKYLCNDIKHHNNSVLPPNFLKSEYLTLGGFHWKEVLIFYRKDSAAPLAHTDNIDPNNITTWGINWIYKGFGLMEYWYLEDFERENVKESIYRSSSAIFHCNPTTPPRLKYLLTPGAYLVNASNAHRATGFSHRYCISYRSTTDRIPWNNIVSHFRDLIINEANLIK
jgi:hypothetical protein